MQPQPTTERLTSLFSALSDPVRRAFVVRLAEGDASVSELCQLVPISMPAVSRHLRVLDEAGLVARDKRGRVTWCALVPGALEEAQAFLQSTREAWSARLDRLEAVLGEE